nr:hypothetical protein [uncultured Cetobacterium sp.]
MNRIYLIIIGLCLCIKSFSYNIDDYRLFQDGVKENQEKNYEKSEFLYSVYERNYQNSYPLQSNYAKYYIGKNFMDLKKYDEGILYLKRAVYVPEKYVKQETKKTNFFQYRRDFYIGKMYLEKGEYNLGTDYLARLVTNYYDPQLEKYEIEALNILRTTNERYEQIYNVKYNGVFSDLYKLNFQDKKNLSEYFYTKKEFEKTEIVLNEMKKNKKFSQKDEIRYLETLFQLGKNDEILKITKDSTINEYLYIRGEVFKNKNDISRAIYNFEKVDGIYRRNAQYEIAKLYYLLGEYSKSKEILKNVDIENEKIDSLLLDIYIKEKNRKRFLEKYYEFRKKYTGNYKQGVYYMIYTQLLNKNEEDPWKIADYNDFFVGNYVVRNYVSSLPNYKIKESERRVILKSTLEKIAKLGNEELLSVAIESPNFALNPQKISDELIVIDSYIKGGFYKEAFERAVENRNVLFKYKDTLEYLYPRYYSEYVKDALKEESVPENMVYTSLYIQSYFNEKNITKNKLGLFGIEKISEIDEKYLMNVRNNIGIGIKKLSEIYQKNNGETLRSLLEFNLGEEAIKNINFEIDGDIRTGNIINEDLRERIEIIIYTYAFYSAIYN